MELSKILEKDGVFPEFYDPDYLVLMLSPYNKKEDFERLLKVLLSVEKRPPISKKAPPLPKPKTVLTPREAIFKKSEVLPVQNCVGRICASAAISCPPAIPLVVCGERIDESVVDSFLYYGIRECAVISE